MLNMKKTLTFLLGLLILLSGCISLKQPRNRIEFYSLEYEPPLVEDLSALPFTIKVDRFDVASTYNTTQIIYRDQSFKREAYTYHKWRDNPGDTVTHFIRRDIRHSNLFRAVLSSESRLESSFTLTGAVDEFLEWDDGEVWNARLSISATLIDDRETDISRKVLFQNAYSVKEPCERKHPWALAEAMSLSLARISEEIIRDVHDYIIEHY